mgnify:CR=1 FL=1
MLLIHLRRLLFLILIEPVGIEIEAHGIKTVPTNEILIEPVGIEMNIVIQTLQILFIILIEPVGIEIFNLKRLNTISR